MKAKSLFVTVFLIITTIVVYAQGTAVVSGIFPGDKPHSLRIFYTSDRGIRIDSVPVNANGTFRYFAQPAKPYRLMVLVDSLRLQLPLFCPPGSDLRITFGADVRLTGKGAAANGYLLRLRALRVRRPNTVNWFLAGEADYLAHLRDSVAAIGPVKPYFNSDGPESAYLEKTVLAVRNVLCGRSVYRYAFIHGYDYARTTALLRNAGYQVRPLARDISTAADFDVAADGTGPRGRDKLRRSTPLEVKRFVDRASLLRDRFMLVNGLKNILGIRFQQNTGAQLFVGSRWQSGEDYFPTQLINGKAAVELIATGITEKDASDYRYHVLTGNSRELIEWRRPGAFRSTSDGKTRYAYLGKFDYRPGQFLTVEIYNVKDYRRRDGMLIDWREPVAPKVSMLADYVVRRHPDGLMSASFDHPYDSFYPNFVVSVAPDIRIRRADSLQQLTFYVARPARTFEYEVTLRKTTSSGTTTSTLPRTTERLTLPKAVWDDEGTYEITFAPRMVANRGRPVKVLSRIATTVRFTVLAPLDDEPSITSRELVLIIFTLALPVIATIWLLRRRHRRRLRSEKEQKERLALQLSSVRSQLNPHFLYNALAGIQNLVNNNQIDDANRYMSRFARLTRNVLDENAAATISVRKEINLLEDYLAMEQLRFQFAYQVVVDQALDVENVEIPAMLVQPYVENAVKHGMATVENGRITVSVSTRNKTLVITIRDNGKSFDPETATPGDGTRLSRERIDLYNRLHKENTIGLQTTTGENGTLITITLNDWL